MRVPVSQSVEMFRGLRANHVPTRLHIAPREGHQWTEVRHQLFKANAELEWFERYVRDRPYVWERAPGDPVDGVKPTIQP
jgi:dipeptidyl aminopeptidase/acylaminoacyl peptidase